MGTGDGCAFKQPNVELSDEQFQVPDLRSKFIKATSGSDQGVINDMTVTNANGQEIKKSGVGVTVSTNVGTTAVIDLTGQFRVPGRTVNLTGNLGFTKPKSPDEEVVSALSFLPHAHYTTTYRCRTIRRAGSDVFELNYFTNASTIGVQNWFDATEEQPACKFYAQTNKWQGGAFNEGGGFGSASFEYYGICKTQCGGYNINCLIPDGEEVVIDTTPEGPCVQKFAGIPLGPILQLVVDLLLITLLVPHIFVVQMELVMITFLLEILLHLQQFNHSLCIWVDPHIMTDQMIGIPKELDSLHTVDMVVVQEHGMTSMTLLKILFL